MENTISRTEHSARNAFYATCGKVAILVVGFVGRVVFTHTLSQDYVGVNGLFYLILTALTLPEFGLVTSMAYNMYEPVAKGDIEKQKSLLRYYRRYLNRTAACIFIIGLAIIPFMGVFVESDSQIEYLYLVYILYLINTVLSYLGIYKRIVLDAHQLTSFWSLYQGITCVIQQVIQILVLTPTQNYLLFLICLLLGTVAANVCTTIKAKKLFPYVDDKEVVTLSAEEEQSLKTNLHSITLHKAGDIAVNNTDTLILSAIVGVVSAGIYYIYYLIVESIRSIYVQIVAGITASVGNLGVNGDKTSIKRTFDSILLLGHWVYGLTAVCLYIILDEFVGIAFGSEYVFESSVTLLICVNFYMTGMCQAGYLFRDSLGLFNFDRYRSVIAATINLIASIVLGLKLGAVGVMLGTLVSTIAISIWLDPVILYRKKFELPVIGYFLKLILLISETGLALALSLWVCIHITGRGIIPMIIRALTGFVITNIIYLLFNCKSSAFALLYDKGMLIIKKKLSIR